MADCRERASLSFDLLTEDSISLGLSGGLGFSGVTTTPCAIDPSGSC